MKQVVSVSLSAHLKYDISLSPDSSKGSSLTLASTLECTCVLYFINVFVGYYY